MNVATMIIALAMAAGLIAGTVLPSTNPIIDRQTSSRDIPASTDTPVPTPYPGIPSEISIPAIGVRAEVESVGLDENQLMDTPDDYHATAWYNLGPRPGEPGSAVIDGHVDTPDGKPAVFANITALVPGDTISVSDGNGHSLAFRITHTESYPTDEFPVSIVFGPSKVAKLNLITCGGTWDRSRATYTERVVVFSELVSN